MSLIKKSDVQNYLSAKRGRSLDPFRRRPSGTASGPENTTSGTKVAADPAISSSLPISPGALLNARLEDSVGVPVRAVKFGSGSW